jgi:hypothetical protein
MSYREFVSEDGRHWRAWNTFPADTRPRGVASAMVDGWLTFEHGSERLRIAPPPSGWEVASDDQLRRWLREARPIVRSSRDSPPTPREEPSGEGASEPGGTVLEGDTRAIIARSRRTLNKMRQAMEESEERNPGLPDR